MNRYRVTALLEAPLVLKQDRQSERSETAVSVPGTALRGALAASYLQHKGKPDDTFQRLFLDDTQCRFGPLDPAPEIYPLSMSACKRQPDAHPKVDQLAYRMALHFNHGRVPPKVHERFFQ